MPDDTAPPLRPHLDALRDRLIAQGRAVLAVVEGAVESLFDQRPEKAAEVIARDEPIDREDVLIEKAAVALLQSLAARATHELTEHDIRLILTIVKVNNEFERVADLAVTIAEQVENVARIGDRPPATFRVMANSIIGIVQSTTIAFARMDADAARLVLASDDTTDAFKLAILREVEEGLAAGRHSVDFAFSLHAVAAALRRMGDHCTNVAEQIIYVASGKIVRHQGSRWSEPEIPAD